MSTPVLPTFLFTLVIVIAAVIWWRIAIVIVGAILIALLATGVREVAGRIDPAPATDAVTGSSIVPAPRDVGQEIPTGGAAR